MVLGNEFPLASVTEVTRTSYGHSDGTTVYLGIVMETA